MTRSGTILLAEDDQDDALLLTVGLLQAGYRNPISVVTDGEQAIQYLKGEGSYANRAKFPIPMLMFLDIKMPCIDGFEVLQWIRSRPEWRHLPVIILTSSYYGAEIERAYDIGANSFLTKPADFQEYVAALKHVGKYWFSKNVFFEPGPFVVAPPQVEKVEVPAAAQATKPYTPDVKRSSKRPDRFGKATQTRISKGT
jgi:CheY-like chemotaxis protein